MQHQWFSDLPKDKQEEFKKSVLGSSFVLDKLHKIVYNMSITESKVTIGDYDSPSWAFKQADRNGYLRALSEILALVTVSDRETKS